LSISDAVVVEGNTTIQEFVDFLLEDQQLLQMLGSVLNNLPPSARLQAALEFLGGFGINLPVAEFTVTLTGAVTGPVSVDFATLNGTAQGVAWDLSNLLSILSPPTAGPNHDYVMTQGTLNFSGIERTRQVLVLVASDEAIEADETFFVTLSNAVGTAIADSQGQGTILNDDGIRIFDTTAREQDGEAIFTVTLNSPLSTTVTVNYTTADGSATLGSDYTAINGTVIFAPGETSQEIVVALVSDAEFEGLENFQVLLSNAVGAPIVDGQATGVINDFPTISIADASVEEGDSGTTSAIFTVVLSSAMSEPVDLFYTVFGETAQDGMDFETVSGMATLAAFETSVEITVPVFGDVEFELDETFVLSVDAVIPGAPEPSSAAALGTIINDDNEPLLMIIDAAAVSDDAPATALFTVHLLAPQDVTVTVDYTSTDDTATAGVDYTAVSGTLSFAPGEVEKTIAVTILADADFEGVETFLVTLSNATGVAIHDSEATGIINDLPLVVLSNSSVVEGDGGSSARLFTVTLSKSIPDEARVDYFTEDVTAQAGSDYGLVSSMLTFAPGETVQTVTIQIFGDDLLEFDEQFRLRVANGFNAQVPVVDSALVTIVDDDEGYLVSIDDVALIEDLDIVQFTVTLTAVGTPPQGAVTVQYTTRDGSADAYTDYELQDGVLFFSPGETAKTIDVLVYDDEMLESDEEFFVDLFLIDGNALLLDDSGTATILNNDSPPPPVVFFGPVSMYEGNEGTTVALFTVTLATDVEITILFATDDDTALAGQDYVATSGQLTFGPGESVQHIAVQIFGDVLQEADEHFTVLLSNLLGEPEVEFLVPYATGTIWDDDTPTQVSISDAQVVEGNTPLQDVVSQLLNDPELLAELQDFVVGFPEAEQAQALLQFLSGIGAEPQVAVFTVTATGVMTGPVTVNFATEDGTAHGVVWDWNNLESLLVPPAAGPTIDYIVAQGSLSFSQTQRSQQVLVLIAPDTAFEPDETFFVTLSNAVGAPIGDGIGLGTILTDDGIRIFGTSVREEDGQAFFDVTLSSPVNVTVTVDYTTSDGSAAAGSDYTAVSGTLTFLPGQTQHQIAVNVASDALPEGIEQFFVQLSNPVGAPLVAGGQATGVIGDFPSINVADASVSEGASGVTDMVFTVNLSGPAPQQILVGYITEDLSALQGSDYEEAAGVLTFATGETSKTVHVQVFGDTEFENDEQFALRLLMFIQDFNSGIVTATGTILNDDVGIFIDPVTVAEGNAGVSQAVFTVTLSNAAEQQVTVEFSTVDGSAEAGTDYGPVSGTLVIAPGETAATISVPIFGDTVFEFDEWFVLQLANPVNASLASAEAIGVISTDEAGILIGDIQVTEGDAGYRAAIFSVTLLGATASTEATVDFTTVDGTAAAGSDYVAIDGTITFAAGETFKQFTVPVISDLIPEPTKSFRVVLSNASGAALVQGESIATIHDNDGGFVITDVVVEEGMSEAVFTVTLLGASPDQWSSVEYGSFDGSAVAGEDYDAVFGTLFFDPGETEQFIFVPIFDDLMFEVTETFEIHLSNPQGAAIVRDEGTASIVNDDGRPFVFFENNQEFLTEGTGSETVVALTVRLSDPSGVAVSVDYATGGGDAEAMTDYLPASGTLVFEPGTTEKTIFVTIVGDDRFENTETFFVTLSNPVNADVFDDQVEVLIGNDDPTPFISVGDVSIVEGNEGVVEAVFEVTLSSESNLVTEVHFQTVNGTAVAGSDYQSVDLTLTFEPGETQKTVIVPVSGDLLNEGNETFSVQLSPVMNAETYDGTAQAIIFNDDPNTAPVLAFIGGKSVEHGQTLLFQAAATDAEGTLLTYTLGSFAPSGASIDPHTGLFTWAPTGQQPNGQYFITIRVTDDGFPALYDEQILSILVT
jgi:hypothetical protein